MQLYKLSRCAGFMVILGLFLTGHVALVQQADAQSSCDPFKIAPESGRRLQNVLKTPVTVGEEVHLQLSYPRKKLGTNLTLQEDIEIAFQNALPDGLRWDPVNPNKLVRYGGSAVDSIHVGSIRGIPTSGGATVMNYTATNGCGSLNDSLVIDVAFDGAPAGGFDVAFQKSIESERSVSHGAEAGMERVTWTGRYFVVTGACPAKESRPKGGLWVYTESGSLVGARDVASDRDVNFVGDPKPLNYPYGYCWDHNWDAVQAVHTVDADSVIVVLGGPVHPHGRIAKYDITSGGVTMSAQTPARRLIKPSGQGSRIDGANFIYFESDTNTRATYQVIVRTSDLSEVSRTVVSSKPLGASPYTGPTSAERIPASVDVSQIEDQIGQPIAYLFSSGNHFVFTYDRGPIVTNSATRGHGPFAAWRSSDGRIFQKISVEPLDHTPLGNGYVGVSSNGTIAVATWDGLHLYKVANVTSGGGGGGSSFDPGSISPSDDGEPFDIRTLIPLQTTDQLFAQYGITVGAPTTEFAGSTTFTSATEETNALQVAIVKIQIEIVKKEIEKLLAAQAQ